LYERPFSRDTKLPGNGVAKGLTENQNVSLLKENFSFIGFGFYDQIKPVGNRTLDQFGGVAKSPWFCFSEAFFKALASFLAFLLSRNLLFSLLTGTGSSPYPPKGLQRKMRHSAKISPTITPHSMIASMAYCEQVGVNRQQGGLFGEMNF